MAINYTQAFNAGELSRNIDGRSDFEVYKIGCRDLDNFFVLPQGGVERRAGSEFVQLAGTDGSSPARMIEFDFSSDIRYVIEIGTNYAKVHYEDASGNNYVVNVTGTVNYTLAELEQIQFNRRYDTLILTCPSKAPQIFRRTTLTPTFTIEEIEYVYPPLQEVNTTTTNINPTAPATNVYTGTTTLLASSAIFHKGHEDSIWAIEHIRDADKKIVADTETGLNTTDQSDALDVSFCNWSFETDGTWVASVIIQRNIAGAGWENYIVIGDTRGGNARNFKYASTVPEDKNTELRVSYITGSGANMTSFEFSIETDNIYHKGLVEIDTVDGADVVISSAALASNVVTIDTATAHGLSTGDYVLISGLGYTTTNPDIEAQITVTDADTFTYALTGADETFTTSASSHIEASSRADTTIVSMIQGGKADPDATVFWNEPSFSDYRGFPPASEFFENRLWLAGSKDQPADLFASAFGDIYNFLGGSLSTDAIKRTIDSPEEPKWLEGKRYLFLGTAGSAVSIRSADKDALITQDNITTLVENSYGSAALQAEIANDVVVYVQRDGLKLRELVYDQTSDTFVGNDLNIISEDVTESGVKEMFVQKQPNQIVWCIKENGDACAMTYERGQQIRGWARIETDGEFYSAASIHNGGEDTVWACVKRTTGEDTPVTKYCIEKFHPRKDLNWYVDSGAEFQGTGSKSGNTVNDVEGGFDHLKINITGHGYSTGDFVNIESSSYVNLTGNNFEVERIDDDNFYLRVIGTTTRLPLQGFAVLGTTRVDGTYNLDRGFGDLGDLQTRYTRSGTEPGPGFIGFTPSQRYISLRWLITQPTPESSDDFAGAGVDFLWNVSWSGEMAGGSFVNTSNASITVKQISNKVTGLSHLEGKTVQVLVDDNYVADKVVASGEVTVDEYGTKVTAGLPYVSTLRPMPIEPTLVNKLSQSRVKAISKIIVRFFKTKGAAVGEQGKQLTTYSVLDTQDSLGQTLDVKTGQQRFFVASDYEREKVIEVRQDLPYPMTVLSIATHINAEGA